MAAVGKRIVAAVAETGVEAEALCLERDLGFAQMLERSVDREPLPFHSGLCCKVGELLKFRDEFGPAVGISGIIESVDSDEDVACAARFGETERKAEKIVLRAGT